MIDVSFLLPVGQMICGKRKKPLTTLAAEALNEAGIRFAFEMSAPNNRHPVIGTMRIECTIGAELSHASAKRQKARQAQRCGPVCFE